MSEEPGAETTYRTYVTVFADFLAVAIHTILYERNIYPRTSFLTAKKYDFAVQQSRHPKVCEWINDAVDAVEAELLKDAVDRVAVIIFSEQHVPLERFVFEVSGFPTVPAGEADAPLQRTMNDESRMAVLPIVDLEEQLRSTMSRLSNCGSSLKVLPPKCTFTVAIELKVEGAAPIGHPQPWCPTQVAGKQKQAVTSDSQRRTMSISSITAGEMMFEVWAEVIEMDQRGVPGTTAPAKPPKNEVGLS